MRARKNRVVLCERCHRRTLAEFLLCRRCGKAWRSFGAECRTIALAAGVFLQSLFLLWKIIPVYKDVLEQQGQRFPAYMVFWLYSFQLFYDYGWLMTPPLVCGWITMAFLWRPESRKPGRALYGLIYGAVFAWQVCFVWFTLHLLHQLMQEAQTWE